MSEPIRVAHVMGKMVGGGLESVVMNYYRHIDREKVQFDFIVDEDSTLVPREEIESLGGCVFIVPPYQRVLAYQKALTALFREQGWKIVHSHENALSVFPLRAAKRAGVPVRIAHSHSTSGPGEPARNAMKWVLRRFANVYPTHRMACSRHAGEWLFGKGAEFDVLYNAIDLSDFSYSPSVRSEVRSDFDVPDGVPAIGHIGRFMPQKNQGFLLDAFAKMVEQGGNAILVFIGEGPQRKDMEMRAKALGIVDRVRFLGQRDDVGRCCQAFDALCLPSLYEGLGIVAVEAQRAGLPVLASPHVPEEADVTGNVRFLDIDNIGSVGRWAKALNGIVCGRRFDIRPTDFDRYDINSAALVLEQKYAEMIGPSMEAVDKWK